MTKFFNMVNYSIIAFAVLCLCGCSDDDKHAGGATEETQMAIEDKTIAGVSEKGPFVNGSAVRLYELNFETLGQTGRAFTGKIASDRGDFRYTHLNLESQYVLLEANGFYRNEVSGEKSAAPITLNALVDVSNKETANINLLTHLSYERMQHLVDDGASVAEAKKQAEQEILKSFYIEDESIGEFEGLSIFEAGKGNAALLAISVLMQGDLSEAEFSERLANYAYDIEKDGVWNDSAAKTSIADWASVISVDNYYANIRKNMENWKLSETIPEFEKSVDKFWWENYGLGDCDKDAEGVIKENQNKGSVHKDKKFLCKNLRWVFSMGENWTVFDDAGDSGTSKIKMDPGVYPIRAEYSLGLTNPDKGLPNVLIKYFLNKDSSTEDISGCAALKYSYKGASHYFEVQTPLITDYGYFYVWAEASDVWKEQTLKWNKFEKYFWATNEVTLDETKKNVDAYVWLIKDDAEKEGTLEVTEVECVKE